MPANDLQRVAARIVERGWDRIRLGARDAETYQALTLSARAFFEAPEDVRHESLWLGHGMWAGYQPIPEGDPDIIDQVERFEAPISVLDTPDDLWPWTTGQALALKKCFCTVDVVARNLIRGLVDEVAQLVGRDAVVARELWCRDDASTVVVNSYVTSATAEAAPTPLMKPHTDFGGITVIHAAAGLQHLQFQSKDEWVPAADTDEKQGELAVVLIGDLFAHWLGTTAPTHQVTHAGDMKRLSTVYFHQPNLDTVIDSPDGVTVVAGEHIASMQEHYNQLGSTTASPAA